MSLITKQIDELRSYASTRKGELAKMINDAADTIEELLKTTQGYSSDTVSRSEVLDIIDYLNDPDWHDCWYEEAKKRVSGLPSIRKGETKA